MLYSNFSNSFSNKPVLNNVINNTTNVEGLAKPIFKEEGSFPIQGNIGSLIRQEADNNYSKCTSTSSISGGPNCSSAFISDIYTTKDTCGSNCVLKEPELYGMQSFGMKDNDVHTNIHGLHAYKNERAAVEGQKVSNYGCYEWNPPLNPNKNCEIDYSINEKRTVGNWRNAN